MSAILRVRKPDGTIVEIPAIKGADGHTPQKGVDYYTEADKQDIAKIVIEALSTTEGVIY